MVPIPVKTYLPVLQSIRAGTLSDRAILSQILDSKGFVEACVIILRNSVQEKNLYINKELNDKLRREKAKIKVLLDRKQSLTNKRRILTVKLVKLIAQIRV